jgi:hypothetical protein
VAAVLSADGDLIEPIRIVTQEPGKTVGLFSPVSNPNPQLIAAASFVRHLAPVSTQPIRRLRDDRADFTGK